ncbi:MAG: aminotransferase class I/II-fold pyridoxal phosphate-dependent enzyme [Phycisphaerales bacterium]|nr:aminotransferase class I/II-fold pyridoxal phosphate-dependent enzyme [Planctomycetota bacterium]MBL6997571.1 aminotransferase class I/II-fold pyridoxal phosphate-dependent enzyme [Phycisphaerales bacterium]
MGRLLSERVKDIETSGIRRAWALAQTCEDPVDLSIGQPDFPVPDSIKKAAIDAILQDKSGYTQTAGEDVLLQTVYKRLGGQFGWEFGSDTYHGAMITSGTAGALTLACLAVLSPGDEIIVPDPYFVIYPTLARIAEAKAVLCDTYPDFRMTAQRIEQCITDKTKAVLLNSPANPTGVVLTEKEVEEIATLCRDHGILLITDEIYDEFVFPPTTHASPAATNDDVLVIRGYGKTYGCTGWRMGYAAGPKQLLDGMLKLKQQTFVCAPSPLQHGLVGAYDIDLSPLIQRFANRRDMVVDMLSDVTEFAVPQGAFYAFIKVPEHLNMTGIEFITKAVSHDVLAIQGSVFSERDSHFRISYAVADEQLEHGLTILKSLLQ